MNKGVELLLARIDSHPQEFSATYEFGYSRYGRWTYQVEAVLSLDTPFTDEERGALRAKLDKLTLEEFTNSVMKELVEGPKSPAELHPIGTLQGVMGSAANTLSSRMDESIARGLRNIYDDRLKDINFGKESKWTY